MAKYRTKSREVDAVQYTEGLECHKELHRVFGCEFEEIITTSPPKLVVVVSKGAMHASPGDWVVRSGKGQLYVHNDIAFQAIYEPVPEGD